MPPNSETQALLPPPYPAYGFIGEEEIQAVIQVLQSRSLSRFIGSDVQGFTLRLEAWYRTHLGRNYAIAVNSGTAALTIGLGALGIGPGDEVLVPGYAWAACYSAVVRVGAIPRLVEIDETLALDPNDLVHKTTPHSRAVLLIHMNGGVGDIARVARICKERGLFLIEDVSQANGGMFNGRPLGSFGDLSVFSFQMNKTITAGEGGLIACDDATLWKRAWMYHDQGYWRNVPSGHDSQSLPQETGWGTGSRMSELAAAMLFTQVTKLEAIVRAMQTCQRRLYNLLADLDVQFRPGTATENDIGNFLVLIWGDKALCKDYVQKTRAAGVCTKTGFGNMPLTETGLHLYYNNSSLVLKVPTHRSGRPWNDPLNQFAAAYSYDKGLLPKTEQLSERTQLLYISPDLTDEVLQKISCVFHASIG